MKALVQIVTCLGEHVAFRFVPVVLFDGEVDEWAVCYDNVEDPVTAAGYDHAPCDQCGDRRFRAEFIACTADNCSIDLVYDTWKHVCAGREKDSYGRVCNRMAAQRALADCVACEV